LYRHIKFTDETVNRLNKLNLEMRRKAIFTERSMGFIERVLSRNFDNNGVLLDPYEFQMEILKEILFLENIITGINHSIEKNNNFIQQIKEKFVQTEKKLVQQYKTPSKKNVANPENEGKISQDSFNEIFKVYNQNLQILKQKRYESKRQIFYIKRLADTIPFSIFPREMIREWVKLPDAGFISFKTGLIGELMAFYDLQSKGKQAILCDLTNCMRTFDIYNR